MSSTDTTATKQPEPADQVFELCLGFIPAICLNVVAKLSIADQLAQGPKSVTDLARVAHVNEDALCRAMRAHRRRGAGARSPRRCEARAGVSHASSANARRRRGSSRGA